MSVDIWGDKRVLTQLGDAPLLILVLYGGMAGVLSGSVLRRLEEIGVTPDAHNVRAICGYSAGTGNALGWCGGMAHGITDVYVHLAERAMTSWRLPPWLDPDPAQVEYLMRYLEAHLGSALPAHTDFYVGVTNWHGQGVCLRAQDSPDDLYDICTASAWLPLPMRHSGIELSIGKCVDGACGFNPLRVIKAVRPRDILILGNRPLDANVIAGEFFPPEVLLRMGLGLYPSSIVDGVMSIDAKLTAFLSRLERLSHIRAVGVFPTHETALRWDECDTRRIRHHADAYYEGVSRVIA